jgi:hypothetical protein
MGRHGCIDVARPERNKKDDEVVDEEMIWICDECLSVNDIDDKNCRECEALKPLPPVSEELETIKDEVGASETIIAAEGNVLSDELGEADIIEVQEAVEFVRAERAVSKNGNDYLKIMFKTEENYWPRSTALMMTMKGKPREVAEKKWRIMSRGFDLPYSIESAVQMVDSGALLEIKKVNLRKEGRYWNVIGVTF